MLKEVRDEIIGVRAGAARNAARALLKRAKVKTSPVYINEIVPLLKKEYDLKAIEALDLSDHLSGFLIQESQMSAIAYNKGHHIHRQRFTTAHEIGHLVLGHNVCDEGDVSPNEESEANIFASELLMPLEFIKRDIKAGGFSVPDLAEKYLVSEQAMGHRFQDPAVLKCF